MPTIEILIVELFNILIFLFLETTKFYMTEIIILPSERNFPIIPRYK